MRRLLQAMSVGKTIVAFEAAIIAMENGHQSRSWRPPKSWPSSIIFRPADSGKCRIPRRPFDRLVEEDRKREIRRHIAQGNAQLVIGTHALIEQKVEFARLGL